MTGRLQESRTCRRSSTAERLSSRDAPRRKALFEQRQTCRRTNIKHWEQRPHQRESRLCLDGRFIMVLEEQRFIHEDLERLEQAIADRVADEPRNVSLLLLSSFSFAKTDI